MNSLKIKVRVVHSQKNTAWNVIGTELGKKYKIARVPYHVFGDRDADEREKTEALKHANFIVYCFNNSDEIAEKMGLK